MGTEVKPDALPDLDDLLQCPVCYEIPTGQIFQCNEGHHVCGRCKSRLAQCPVCRALFFGTRNYAMEELIANVRKLQAFKLGGKMTITSGSESTASADNSVANLDESAEDEETEDFSGSTVQVPAACKGLFRCLCCKNGNVERLPAARLLNHLRYFHNRDLLEGKSEGGEYVQAWQIATVPGRIVIAVRVADMGVFFLVIEINDNSIYSWVSMAASPWIAHEFNYTVTISGNDREAIFTDCVWSVRSCEGTLKKRERCLVVSGADVRALTATANINGRLALRRAPPDQLTTPAQPRAVLRVANRGSATPLQPENIEPFLQDLQHDVARLHRAFATLGREASALARSEAQVRTRIEATAQPRPERNVSPPAIPAPQVIEERQQLSRNARRRMRQRLRATLDAPQPVPESQPQQVTPGQAQPRAQNPPQTRPVAQSQQRAQMPHTQAQAQRSAQIQAQPRIQGQPQLRTQVQGQPQHQRSQAQVQAQQRNAQMQQWTSPPVQVHRVGLITVVEAEPTASAAQPSGPSNGLHPSGCVNRGGNKKKRRQRR